MIFGDGVVNHVWTSFDQDLSSNPPACLNSFHLNSRCDLVHSCVGYIMLTNCCGKSYMELLLETSCALKTSNSLATLMFIFYVCIWTNSTNNSLVFCAWMVLVMFGWVLTLSSLIVVMLVKACIFALLKSMQLWLHLFHPLTHQHIPFF